ncbi:hypothetical protein ACVWZ4_000947 [Bradyrhizobium sp. USDA 4472]
MRTSERRQEHTKSMRIFAHCLARRMQSVGMPRLLLLGMPAQPIGMLSLTGKLAPRDIGNGVEQPYRVVANFLPLAQSKFKSPAA